MAESRAPTVRLFEYGPPAHPNIVEQPYEEPVLFERVASEAASLESELHVVIDRLNEQPRREFCDALVVLDFVALRYVVAAPTRGADGGSRLEEAFEEFDSD